MTLIESELRAALRAEAAAHRPDREAILDRITEAAIRNRQAPRFRVAGVAVAVTAILGAGGFAQWAMAGDGNPTPPVVTVEPSPSGPASSSPSPSAGTPSASPSRTSPRSRPPGRSPSAPASSATSPVTQATAQGALWSDGSVVPDSDSQGSSVVTVRTSERLTALEVTIRLARTDGLTARGGSQQVPGASVTSTVTEEPGAIVYRFVLSSGDTLEPGTYTFSARYTHVEGGRNAAGDLYAAAATTEAAAAPKVSGDFR
ncbi:hypothetical protein Ait01nite_083820 [Actinoplanes italicus]|uniref:Uncharacterized protein n=1 Tax=Actinoplanes italicus TaxID=113567 RepID=A0A2T0JYE7_9ACTN|nr:hypothetical protein [Actinoplanes italicus]PRX12994.1 hypothetical protein CLV67_126119 [Actinoplanes italicus]GIE35337.1 hypothetical protein Ait01nite_083820 [Actinoplanes italicus]